MYVKVIPVCCIHNIRIQKKDTNSTDSSVRNEKMIKAKVTNCMAWLELFTK